MNLMEAYDSNRITSHRLWISSDDNEVFQVNCGNLIRLVDEPNFMGIKQGEVLIEKWVWDNINMDCAGWRDRIRIFLVVDGSGNEKAFKILSDKILTKVLNQGNEENITYSFFCREDKDE